MYSTTLTTDSLTDQHRTERNIRRVRIIGRDSVKTLSEFQQYRNFNGLLSQVCAGKPTLRVYQSPVLYVRGNGSLILLSGLVVGPPRGSP